jgi:spore coat protein A, manganese oxidase
MHTGRHPIGKRMSLALIVMLLATLAVVSPASAVQSPQLPLPGSAIPQFVQQLPTLIVQPGGTMTTIVGNRSVTLRMCEFKANVLPTGAVPNYAGTWVWGYLVDAAGNSTCAQLIALYGVNGIIDTYIGPVIVNDRGSSTDVTYVNDLGSAATTNVLAYKYSTDQTLHWADPLAPGQAMANECMMKMEMGGWIVNGLSQNYPPPGDPCAENYTGPIAAVPHLHGGEVPPEIDGSPDSWFTSDGLHFGHKYYSAAAASNSVLYKYPNTQEASPIWFHDHTLGATRLNVYAGLAGAYFIEDPATIPVGKTTTRGTPGTCTTGCLPPNLQPLAEVVPVVIQDRTFDTNGQLFLPGDTAGGVLWSPNPEHPYWVPEFVGDTIVVNGKAWPFLNVDPKRYRFLFLNGSNARTYELNLNAPMWVIGTDGGYLDAPVPVKKLVMMPGERYEVIIDFASLGGKNLILTNTGKTPYPAGKPPQGATLGRIMQFRVQKRPAPITDASYNPKGGGPLRTGTNALVRLVNPATGILNVTAAKTRELTLNEVMGMPMPAIDPVTGLLTKYPGGPLEILVNNTKWSGMSARGYDDFTPITVNGVTTAFSEMPVEGDTEVWEIVNMTADAHPIHLHLVQFQIINRQSFNAGTYAKAYAAQFPAVTADPMCIGGVFCPGFGPPLNYDPAFNPLSGGKLGGNPDVAPYLQGPTNLPAPQEAGWKDTVIAYPGQVTRLAVRWAPTSLPANSPAAALYYPFDPNADNQYNYVWHCHIIDHEDNEMMRPDVVTLNPLAPLPAIRPLVKGTAY